MTDVIDALSLRWTTLLRLSERFGEKSLYSPFLMAAGFQGLLTVQAGFDWRVGATTIAGLILSLLMFLSWQVLVKCACPPNLIEPDAASVRKAKTAAEDMEILLTKLEAMDKRAKDLLRERLKDLEPGLPEESANELKAELGKAAMTRLYFDLIKVFRQTVSPTEQAELAKTACGARLALTLWLIVSIALLSVSAITASPIGV